MKQLGIAIIGTGEIAQNFHIPVLKEIASVKVLAVCDLNKSLAAAVADKFDIADYYEHIDEVLKNDKIDSIVICSTTDSHYELAKKSIEAGKSVYIEKPAAMNYEETKDLSQLAEKHYAKVMVGMNQRFRSDAVILKNFMNRGEVGNIYYIKAGWLQQRRGQKWLSLADKAGGGVLFDLGIPIIDSLLWLIDDVPVSSVSASIFNHRTKNVEDICYGSLRFENGSIATIETSWSLFSKKGTFFCDVFGSDGSAKINPIRLFKSNGELFTPVGHTFTQSNFLILKKSFESALKHFVNSSLNFSPLVSTLSEAAERHRIIEAMYKSAKEGREIFL